ncbi:unnamed protein product [Cuscuta europaea]|uniref:Uncharacterized protein n=1 Tax=Cuscuta europaea TaxID=41803 RepID=A0A9P0YV31_CUSEU|nr:unnamed protein product [Cuscuta europaea]
MNRHFPFSFIIDSRILHFLWEHMQFLLLIKAFREILVKSSRSQHFFKYGYVKYKMYFTVLWQFELKSHMIYPFYNLIRTIKSGRDSSSDSLSWLGFSFCTTVTSEKPCLLLPMSLPSCV